MPLGHLVVSTDLSMRANMTIEAEIDAFDNNFDVRIEELRNEAYFDGFALKIKSLLRVSVALAEDPESCVVFEAILNGVEPRRGRYPISRYEFEVAETNARNEETKNMLIKEALRSFEADIVYSHAHFHADQ